MARHASVKEGKVQLSCQVSPAPAPQFNVDYLFPILRVDGTILKERKEIVSVFKHTVHFLCRETPSLGGFGGSFELRLFLSTILSGCT